MPIAVCFFFFFNDTATTEIYTLSLHDALPIYCTVPPLPAPERAYHVGTVLRDVLRAYPGDDRIAVIATGGLSHEPGGPRYFWIDEEFDRWFLDLLAKGDHETLLAECTLERMEAAGSGGTAD